MYYIIHTKRRKQQQQEINMRRRTQPTREATINQLLEIGTVSQIEARIQIMEREIDYLETVDGDEDIDTLEDWIMMLQIRVQTLS
jgi:uncharacterized small protein (DUF1192 family)